MANYIEPFAGSLAVLLGRPTKPRIETVNDLDGFICNFWRAVAADPEQVAHYADWPVNECDQHARHAWLVGQRETLTRRLEGNPDYYDAKVAGYWLYGICCWIGAGWCSGDGPWFVDDDGQLVHLGSGGQGVHRKRVHLNNNVGIHRPNVDLIDWMEALAERLRGVRVCCGDWTRVLGPTPTVKLGRTGVFLDPPYATSERTADLYAVDTDVSAAVRAWAIAHQDDPDLLIALCGYSGEHTMPDSWECVPWKANGGYGMQGDGVGRANAHRERIWFNRAAALRRPTQIALFPLAAPGVLLDEVSS